MTPSLKRLCAASAAAASLMAVAVPGTAPAASVTYIKDNNVWITDSEGSYHRQITTNGTANAPYRTPYPSTITLWWNAHAAIPAQTGHVVCTSLVPSFAKDAKPRFSPDGAQIVFSGPDGVYVSPIPKTSNDGSCHLQFKLIAPGGSDADFGAKDLQVPGGGDTGNGQTPD